MNKQIAAVVAVVALTAISGCGGNDSADQPKAQSVESTPKTTDEVTSWKSLGQVGLNLYVECESEGRDSKWPCLSGQISDLEDAQQKLPATDRGRPWVFQSFLDTYDKWEANQCYQTASGKCAVYETQLSTHSDMVRNLLVDLSEGRS